MIVHFLILQELMEMAKRRGYHPDYTIAFNDVESDSISFQTKNGDFLWCLYVDGADLKLCKAMPTHFGDVDVFLDSYFRPLAFDLNDSTCFDRLFLEIEKYEELP